MGWRRTGVEARLVRDANMWLLGRLGCVSLLPYLIPPSDYWRNYLTMAGVLLSFVPAPRCQLAALRSYFSLVVVWSKGATLLQLQVSSRYRHLAAIPAYCFDSFFDLVHAPGCAVVQ